MEILTEQLQKFWDAEDTNRQAERNKFFKMLSVKIFEASINDKTLTDVFRDFRVSMEKQQVERYNKLARAFGDIHEILFK